jgi:hypothetical protein
MTTIDILLVALRDSRAAALNDRTDYLLEREYLTNLRILKSHCSVNNIPFMPLMQASFPTGS